MERPFVESEPRKYRADNRSGGDRGGERRRASRRRRNAARATYWNHLRRESSGDGSLSSGTKQLRPRDGAEETVKVLDGRDEDEAEGGVWRRGDERPLRSDHIGSNFDLHDKATQSGASPGPSWCSGTISASLRIYAWVMGDVAF